MIVSKMSVSESMRKVLQGVLPVFFGLALAGCGADREPSADPIQLRLGTMDVRGRAAQTVAAMVSLDGGSVAERLRIEIAAGAAGALLVRGGDARELTMAVRQLRLSSPHPLLVIAELDSRRGGTTELPPAWSVATVASHETSAAVGEHAALEAKAIGADIGLISLPPLNGNEPLAAAARDPEAIVNGVGAYVEGVREAGLHVVLQALWSPDSLPRMMRWDRARLNALELRELGALVEANPVGVALGAVRLVALTGDSLPLPFAPTAVEGLLRRELGFEGLVMADISAGSPLVRELGAPAAAVAAIAAGVDLLLGAEAPAAVVDALAAAVEQGTLNPRRLETAARRVMQLQLEIGTPDSLRIPPDSVRVHLRTAEALELAGTPAVRAAWEIAGSSFRREPESSTHLQTDSLIWAFRRTAEGGLSETEGGRTMGIRWPPAPVLRVLPPDSVGMGEDLGERIDAIMQEGLEDSIFSAGAVAVGRRGGLVVLRGYGKEGRRGEGDPVDPRETIFDLASLTKVIGTTTAVAVLVDEGTMELDAPIERYLPNFDGDGKEEVLVRHLLTHTSGMPSGIWLFGSAGSPGEALRQVLGQDLLRAPGERMDYSDLGMILLAEAAERVAEMSLDEFLAQRVFAPLGMASTMYLPPLALRDRIAPTAEKTEREFALQGVVHDANSFRLGGVAGHAGLFSTAADLAIFAQMMLNGGSYGTVEILSPKTVSAFTTRQPDAEQRALGWDTPSRVSSAGAYFSAHSFGHTGYTGTSLWVDPESGIFVVLLTNRTYLDATAGEVLRLRAAVHDAAARAVTGRTVRRRAGAR